MKNLKMLHARFKKNLLIIQKSSIGILSFFVFLFFLNSCDRISKNEMEALKAENEKLKLEIDFLKYGAENLFELASFQIENQQKYEAKESLKTLLEKHPISQQAAEAKKLLEEVNHYLDTQKMAQEQANKLRLANATKKLRSNYDAITAITWYYDQTTPQQIQRNSFHLYMGQKDLESPTLNLQIQYKSDTWLFIESYMIKTDHSLHTINTRYGDIQMDNGLSGIWEWYDIPLDAATFKIIEDIINSKTVKLRYQGKQYFKDRDLTANEIQALKNILDAYESLGGDINFLYKH
jgi:hypothetical protein